MTPPDSMTAAVDRGDELAALKVLRARLAADLDGCRSARDLAALSRRYLAVGERIAEHEHPGARWRAWITRGVGTPAASPGATADPRER